MAADLGRDIKFILKLKEDDPENLRVLVINSEKKIQYHWDLEKALNRHFLIKDLYS